MVSDRANIFHMFIPWGKTFSLKSRSRSSVEVKVKYQCHNFQMSSRCGGICVHKQILFSKFEIHKNE